MQITYFVNMFDYTWKGLQISDIALVILLIISLLKLKRIPIKRNSTLFLLGLFFISVWTSMMLNISQDYFSFSNFILAFIKLVFYSACFLIIPFYLSSDFWKLEKIIKKSILIISVLGFYQFIIHNYFPSLPYSLIPSFFEQGSQYSTLYSYGGTFRIRSIFGEPAHFSIYLNILYFFLIYSKSKIEKKIHIAVIIGVFLSMSLSGIALLIVNIIVQVGKVNLLKHKKTILIGLATITLVSFILVNNDYIMYRVFRIMNMTENSGVSRLIGSWEVALKAPFYGVGLGNFHSYGQSTIVQYNFTRDPSNIHNIIAVLLLSSGYIGTAIFICLLISIFRNNKFELLFLLVLAFSWGQFNNTPFWFLLILINSHRIYKSKYARENKLRKGFYYENINS